MYLHCYKFPGVIHAKVYKLYRALYIDLSYAFETSIDQVYYQQLWNPMLNCNQYLPQKGVRVCGRART